MKAVDENNNICYLEFANKKAAQNFINFNKKFSKCMPFRANITDMGVKPWKTHTAWVIADNEGRAVMANLEFETD